MNLEHNINEKNEFSYFPQPVSDPTRLLPCNSSRRVGKKERSLETCDSSICSGKKNVFHYNEWQCSCGASEKGHKSSPQVFQRHREHKRFFRCHEVMSTECKKEQQMFQLGFWTVIRAHMNKFTTSQLIPPGAGKKLNQLWSESLQIDNSILRFCLQIILS